MNRLVRDQRGAFGLLATILALAVLVVIVFVIWSFVVDGDDETDQPVPQAVEDQGSPQAEEEPAPTFEQQQFQQTKSPHFVKSRPENNQLSTQAIEEVAIDFNFDLAEGSKINVTRDGTDIASGPTVIAGDNLSMSVPVDADQTGNYNVTYTACWPDGSCHDGSFGFSVKLGQ